MEIIIIITNTGIPIHRVPFNKWNNMVNYIKQSRKNNFKYIVPKLNQSITVSFHCPINQWKRSFPFVSESLMFFSCRWYPRDHWWERRRRRLCLGCRFVRGGEVARGFVYPQQKPTANEEVGAPSNQ